MQRNKLIPMIEGACVVAMGVVLSYVIIFKLPWGGAITLLSMLPVGIYSIKYGVKKGLMISFVFSLFQFIQGIGDGIFAWGLTTVMLVSCIFLDYILAYTLIGFAGIFRSKGIKGWIFGMATAITMRFLCHFISGAVIFHSAGKLWDNFSTENTYLYSLIYNGCYMLPEMIFTCIGAFVLFRVSAMKKMICKTEDK